MLVCFGLLGSTAHAGEIKPDRDLVYKTVGDVKLKLHVFDPAGLHTADARPAIVFFFGGGWSAFDSFGFSRPSHG